MTIAEAAQLTGLSEQAIRRRIERGVLPAEVVGRKRRLALADLQRAGLLREAAAVPIPDDREEVGELLDRIERTTDELGGMAVELRARLARREQRRG